MQRLQRSWEPLKPHCNWCSSSVSVKCSMPPCMSHRMSPITLSLWLLGLFDFTFSACPPPHKSQPLWFCFFRFDSLKFDWSSSNRFGGYGGCRGWLFFYFFLTGTRRVTQCLRFTCITVHFLGFASYLFALLLLREEPLRGLKNLCSLLCQHLGPNVLWLSPLPTALFWGANCAGNGCAILTVAGADWNCF